MILFCEFIKRGDSVLNIVSTVNIEVDDCDADAIICEPSQLDGDELVCITAVPVSRTSTSY